MSASHNITSGVPRTTSDKSEHDAGGFSIAKLPRILRGLGAAILIASVSIFLFQGWESGNDTYRYFLLLVHTAGLAIVGFLSGHWMRESKGARLLLALALASIPANFAILGGFVYSQFSMDSFNVVYPMFVAWQADSATAALLTTGISLVVLAPVVWLGFMVLARRSAGQFTLLYLLTNLAILIPLRSADIVGWLALGIAILVMAISARARRKDSTLTTPEGIIARTVQFLPLAVILGRSLWLYSADAFLITIVSLVVFLVLRHVALLMAPQNRSRTFIEAISLLPAIFVGLGMTEIVHDAIWVATEARLPVFSITVAALCLELSTRAANGGAAYRRAAAIVVAFGMLVNLGLFGGVVMAATCLALGLGLMVYGYFVEQRVVFSLGVATLLFGLGFQLTYAIQMFDLGSWGSLAILGISAILVGSAMERYGNQIKLRLSDWGQQFRDWQY